MYRPDCQFRHRESTIPGRYTLVAQKLIEHAREDPNKEERVRQLTLLRFRGTGYPSNGE